MHLKPREKEIIKLAAKGYSSKEIGEHLFLSHRTVEGYFAKIYSKLNVKDKAELIAYAFKWGLL